MQEISSDVFNYKVLINLVNFEFNTYNLTLLSNYVICNNIMVF